MQKTIEQLQADLDREKAYITKLNRQIDRLRDQLRSTISLSEHERLLASVQQECEANMTKIKNQQQKPHNERGAGRKRKATREIAQRVMALHTEGLSQKIIAQSVSNEFETSISRTTVGEIIRGEHNERIQLPHIFAFRGLDKSFRERYDLVTAEKAVPKEV